MGISSTSISWSLLTSPQTRLRLVPRNSANLFLDCNEAHSAKNCMKDLQKPTQCAQKISVYGLPGRCKHLDCLVFQHLESRLAVQDQLARYFLDLNQLFVSKSSPKYQCTYFASNNCCSKHLPSTWRVAWSGSEMVER